MLAVSNPLSNNEDLELGMAIEDVRGDIDYDECGAGPAVVLVPGSCSTGAAWRPIMAQWDGRFRCVTTSLLGYGGTAERRTSRTTDIALEAEIIEAVVRRAGAPVHLVGHSFGGLSALAVALRKQVALSSLTIIEAPAPEMLRQAGEDSLYRSFRDMTEAYFNGFYGGNGAAIGLMIDFYGGQGTFASWPQRVRSYAIDTTAVNLLDWKSAYGFAPSAEAFASLALPTLVLRGGASNAAMLRANELIARSIRDAAVATIHGAAHFLVSTHAEAAGRLIAGHVSAAEAQQRHRHIDPLQPGASEVMRFARPTMS